MAAVILVFWGSSLLNPDTVRGSPQMDPGKITQLFSFSWAVVKLQGITDKN
jgi:hypothetical protein